MSDSTASAAARPRRVRWLPGVILLVLAPISVVAAWMIAGQIADGDRTVQMTAAIVTLAIAVLLQAIWWIGLARLSWRGRLLGVVGLALLVAAVAGVVRIDGYRGEMMPIFAFRWEPTPEERALAFIEGNKSSGVDLSAAETDVVTVREGDWPQYRGADRSGRVNDAVIRTDWNEVPLKAVWGPQPVGPAWSSFAIVGNRAFTQEQRGEEETVVCYDASSGRQLWVHADQTRFSEALGGDGPRGTPTCVGETVYALGATGLLNCLESATGRSLWQRNILQDAGNGEPVKNIDWGMAGSPPVWEGKVFAVPGGAQKREVIAYDAITGDILWANGDGNASYASPRIETIGGVPQLLVFDGDGLKSFEPSDGTLLWSFGPWTNQPKVNASQPIVQGDKVFISSGYTIGSVLLHISQESDAWKVDEVWRNDNEFKLKFNDAILHEGFLFGLDEGILACYEFETGKRRWKNGRYGYGQMILLGNTLVILAEDGTLAAVSASPEGYEELARVPVLEGKTWNHPAYANGKLFIRNDREAACIELGL